MTYASDAPVAGAVTGSYAANGRPAAARPQRLTSIRPTSPTLTAPPSAAPKRVTRLKPWQPLFEPKCRHEQKSCMNLYIYGPTLTGHHQIAGDARCCITVAAGQQIPISAYQRQRRRRLAACAGRARPRSAPSWLQSRHHLLRRQLDHGGVKRCRYGCAEQCQAANDGCTDKAEDQRIFGRRGSSLAPKQSAMDGNHGAPLVKWPMLQRTPGRV
jgi:hypothetical protein